MGLNEIIGATHAIEGSAYWIALVVSWMQTLGSQPVVPKISLITRTRGLHTVVLPSNLAQHSSFLCLIKHIKQWLHMGFVLNLDKNMTSLKRKPCLIKVYTNLS